MGELRIGIPSCDISHTSYVEQRQYLTPFNFFYEGREEEIMREEI